MSIFNGIIENVNWNDVGRTLAETLNTLQLVISTFWNEIKWDKLGVSAGQVINSFFLNWDEQEAAKLVKGKLQAVLDFANNLLSTTDFAMIGEKIGKFLADLHIEDYADDIAALIWNLLKAAFNLLPSMFEEAPIETALMLGVTGYKFDLFGNKLGGGIASSVSRAFSPKLASLLTTDISKLQFHSGIKGAGELLGVALGEAFCAAAAAYIGYNLGLEIGKKIHPEDAMWYKEDAWLEAFSQPEYWDDAIKEFSGSNRSDFGYFKDDQISSIYPYLQKLLGADSNDTWGDVKENLRRGKTYITDSDFQKIKEFLEDSGVSASEINNLMNQLKSARDQYENGFKVWMQNNAGLLEREGIGVDEAYNRYTTALDEQDEITRKMEALANSPITRYNNAKQVEENVSALNDEIEAWNGLSGAQQNFLRVTNQMPEHIFDFHKTDTFDVTKKSIDKFAGALGSFGKKNAEVMATAITDMFRFGNVFKEVSFGISTESDTLYNTLNSVESRGSGLFTGEARNIENLNTKLLLTKDGIDKISGAFDVMESKKDKTNSIKDSFDGVKGKVDEVANLFSADKMASMFSSIPDAFKVAWQNAINVMKVMWTEMANWINANAKIEVPKVKVGNNEIGGQTVQLKIPRFDIGGSIPNNGSLFVANERGPEVMANMGSRTGIMNTDQMKDAIRQGMAEALAMSGQNVQVVLNGDAATFFTAMVKENNSSIMRTGTSPLRV